jgi:hypothetical protein
MRRTPEVSARMIDLREGRVDGRRHKGLKIMVGSGLTAPTYRTGHRRSISRCW